MTAMTTTTTAPIKRTAYAAWSVVAILVIYVVGLFFAAWALGEMLWKQVHSTRWLFGYKRRPSPPKCLQDPNLGQHGYVTVKGLKFHYVEKGDRSKPLMLFAHGFPDFWYSWRHQMKEFCNDYWTVAVDMRGYGESAKPPCVDDYSMYCMVEDIKGIVTELGRNKFTLVGHDWGAIVSWYFLETYPEMVDKYVIMNGPNAKVFMQLSQSSESDQRSKSWYMYLFQLPYLAELYVSFGDLALFRLMLLGHKKSNPFVTEQDIEAYKYTFSQPGRLTPPLNYYRAFFRKVIKHGLAPRSTKTNEKTETVPPPKGLYIFGAKDVAIDVKCVGLLKAQVKNLETHIIEEGNHFVQQDETLAVNKAMRSFLLK